MSDQITDVIAFHRAANQVDGDQSTETVEHRARMVEEEARELAEAIGAEAPGWEMPAYDRVDLVEFADAAADLAYVALGALVQVFGARCARAVWDEVQRSNMAKFPDGRARKTPEGKVIKPEGWKPPDLTGVLRRHGIPVPEPCGGDTLTIQVGGKLRTITYVSEPKVLPPSRRGGRGTGMP